MIYGRTTGFVLANALSCEAGYEVIAEIPDTEDWSLREFQDTELRSHELTMTVPLQWALDAGLTTGQVIQRHASYQGASNYDEFRVQDVVEDYYALTARLVATDPIEDLAEQDSLIYDTVNGVVTFAPRDQYILPADALTNRVLAYAPSHWALGTVDPMNEVNLDFESDSPLSAARKIAAAVNAASSFNINYVISSRRNGTTGYYVDLTLFVAAEFTQNVDLHTRTNLLRLQRRTRRHAQITRAFFSGDAPLHRPLLEVTAVTANTHITVGPFNRLHPSLQLGNDSLNGLVWVELKNGTEHAITDVDSGGSRLYMASTTTISAGDRGYLARSGKLDLVSVAVPEFVASYGEILKVLEPAYDGYPNLLYDPDFGDPSWSSGTPPDWTLASGTAPTRVTTAGKFQYGGCAAYSQHATLGMVLQQSFDVYCETTGFFDIWFQVALNAFNAGMFARLRDPQAGTNTDIPFDGSVAGLDQLGVLVNYRHRFQITSAGVKTCTIGFHRTVAGASNAFWIDAVQLVWLPDAYAVAQPGFRSGSGAMWNISRAKRALVGHPPVTYEGCVARDLALTADGERAPAPIVVGGRVRFLDADFGQLTDGGSPSSYLITGIRRNGRDETQPELEIEGVLDNIARRVALL